MGPESIESFLSKKIEEVKEKRKEEEPQLSQEEVEALTIFLVKIKERFEKTGISIIDKYRRTPAGYIEAYLQIKDNYGITITPKNMDSLDKFGSENPEIEVKGKKMNVGDYTRQLIEEHYREGITDLVKLRDALSSDPHFSEVKKYLVGKHISPHEIFESFLPYYRVTPSEKHPRSITGRLESASLLREVKDVMEKFTKEK